MAEELAALMTELTPPLRAGEAIPAGSVCTISGATGLVMVQDSGGQQPIGVAAALLPHGAELEVGPDSLLREAPRPPVTVAEFARQQGELSAWPMCGPPSVQPAAVRDAWQRRWADRVAERQEISLFAERVFQPDPGGGPRVYQPLPASLLSGSLCDACVLAGRVERGEMFDLRETADDLLALITQPVDPASPGHVMPRLPAGEAARALHSACRAPGVCRCQHGGGGRDA